MNNYSLKRNFHWFSRPILWFGLLIWSCAVAAESQSIDGLDFQRNQQGQAVLILTFSGSPVLPATQISDSGLELSFADTQVVENLQHLYDTSDFNTLVSSLSVAQVAEATEVSLEINSAFSHSLHQEDKELRLVVSAKAGARETRGSSRHFQYTGEPMSLSYQNIPVRQLLKELADFLGLNLVAGENVRGEITLQLQNVPSDQALDLILKTQNLASRQVGNVLLVAPTSELVDLEEQQFAAQRSEQAMEPLVDEFIQVHFARAEDLHAFILGDVGTSETRTTAISAGLFDQQLEPSTSQSNQARRFLSDRGHLMVDRRTNQVYVRDTAEQVERVRQIIRTLDVPVEQIMIEARIVIARTGAVDDIGVTWGLSRAAGEASSEFSSTASRRIGFGSSDFESESSRGSAVNFNPSSGIGIGFVNNNFLLDLELAALESENRSEVISRPKVITSDRVQATITSGEEIPYQGRDDDGNPVIIFRNAALRLEATPHITHDGRILMDLDVRNDSKGEATNIGFTINTESMQTQVLANNGETIVIGGIFTSQTLESESKVPILGDLPLIGGLFRNSFSQQEKVELLIFITPRMLESSFTELQQAARRPSQTNPSPATETPEHRLVNSAANKNNSLKQEAVASVPAALEVDELTYILQQPEDRFVLQVYADSSRERAEDLIQNQAQPEQFTLVPTVYDSQPWYIVIYGDYPDSSSASAAIESLPRSLQRTQPWARSYRVMQRLVRARVNLE